MEEKHERQVQELLSFFPDAFGIIETIYEPSKLKIKVVQVEFLILEVFELELCIQPENNWMIKADVFTMEFERLFPFNVEMILIDFLWKLLSTQQQV